MKLYRMELYKLCHRKIVIISAFFMFVIQMLFCAMKGFGGMDLCRRSPVQRI